MTFCPKRPCTQPGCKAWAVDRGLCQDHYARRMKAYFARADARRMETEGTARAVKIRSSSNWARVRAAYRSAFPLCCDPLNAHRGLPEPSEHVHHVIPLVERPDLAFDWENLRSVCANCHLRIEGMERKGSKTSHLFDGKREPHEVAKPT